MKDASVIHDDTEPSVAVPVDPDADDPEASTLLDTIAQDDQADVDPEAQAPEQPARSAASPFLLESLYFRSFGERTLLHPTLE